jgi:hypothetical protein
MEINRLRSLSWKEGPASKLEEINRLFQMNNELIASFTALKKRLLYREKYSRPDE